MSTSTGTGTSSLRGTLLLDEPLGRYTSWRVGGPAKRLYRPADQQDLACFLAGLEADEPLFWLGLGSNLLISDTGFPGTLIHTQGCLNTITAHSDTQHSETRGSGEAAATTLRVEAGASCAKLARFASRLGLVGAEFLAGIPGTLGGALAMNAGAWGGETWPLVERVRTIDREGQIRERARSAFRAGYRQVTGPEGEWFLSADLVLAPGDSEAAQARIRTLLDQRAATQPIGLPSCGSVFRNPPGDHAARLIEAAGLKGRRLGGAEVSPKHANFIINLGEATAREIAALIDLVQDAVERHSGIRLQPEVRRLGAFS
ncbi:UDP-N-acetylenolpyruvoylglucosamine reductase [Halochromatium salexigens]|uniref:UDP-N-acetylenolpyruvoylglucosamine reductase n=2 Tax=Halochromatium salexigens TaxID=49447 RepID=A0AAJ0XGB8_HALSE|nr:UDP-N-acetylenolpyruvoylglucosamine reductase [Halochromatium salexigens]